MTDIPLYRPGQRHRGGMRRPSNPINRSSTSAPASGHRPYRSGRPRKSGRGYVESRLTEASPLAASAAASPSAGGYQPTVRVDFTNAFQPTGRTLQEEMAGMVAGAPPARTRSRSRRKADSGTSGDQPTRLQRFFKHPKLVVATGIFTVMLLLFGIYVAPVLYAGARAYRDVFVENGNRQPAPAIAVVNAEQTPITAEEAKNIPTPTPAPEWTGTEPLNLLLIGIDRREDEATRSDTMIMIHIDPVTQKASMLAIPRDTKVIIPGYGVNKINAAYAFGDAYEQDSGGGPGLVMETIEANFGVHIDHYAEVDFTGFEKVIDTVGGVTIDNPYPIKDDEYPAAGNDYMRIYFPAGWQHLNGERALQYARTRHDDGDAMRSIRQEQVLMALLNQAQKSNLISNAAQLIGEFGDTVRMDLSPSQALELARLGMNFNQDNITQYSLMPALTEVTDPDQPYYLVPSWDDAAAILTEFAGETITPPASALANPTLDTPIVIRNASATDGMATRVSEALTTEGFTNVSIDYSGDGEAIDYTAIIDRSGDLATAMYLAGVIGVPIDSVSTGATDSTAGTPADWGEDGSISITLGMDAPDPAYYDSTYFASTNTDEGSGALQETVTPEPTSTPAIDYTLGSTGNPSTSSDGASFDEAGDLSGGPETSLPVDGESVEGP
jgi:LCP family protein required for cell wall assembly